MQENAKSSAGPEEGSPKMERNPEVVPTVPDTVPERRLEGLHTISPKTSGDTILSPIAVQSDDQNGKFIIITSFLV